MHDSSSLWLHSSNGPRHRDVWTQASESTANGACWRLTAPMCSVIHAAVGSARWPITSGVRMGCRPMPTACCTGCGRARAWSGRRCARRGGSMPESTCSRTGTERRPWRPPRASRSARRGGAAAPGRWKPGAIRARRGPGQPTPRGCGRGPWSSRRPAAGGGPSRATRPGPWRELGRGGASSSPTLPTGPRSPGACPRPRAVESWWPARPADDASRSGPPSPRLAVGASVASTVIASSCAGIFGRPVHAVDRLRLGMAAIDHGYRRRLAELEACCHSVPHPSRRIPTPTGEHSDDGADVARARRPDRSASPRGRRLPSDACAAGPRPARGCRSSG
jgi:hypothetical protein